MTLRILLVTLEPIARQMAGPAIRCVELGKQLSSEFDVTVFSPRPSDINSEDIPAPGSFKLVTGSRSQLYEAASSADVLFVQGNVLKQFPRLGAMGKYLVVDLYDPYLLSVLAQYRQDSVSSDSSYNLMHQVLEKHMARADFSVCASERQRDYWLGRYCALGRLSPRVYAEDQTFRKLIDVVPFGLPAEKPVKTGPGAKGRLPGIEKADFLLVWGGGIWEWFDPLTVIRAVGELCIRYPRLKLYFMGYKSPNPQVPVMDMAQRAYSLSQQRGLLNRHVFFCPTWTAYDERVNFLLDADCAVSAHFDVLETRFSFRTRILDYLWAGLPILTTTGDRLAEEIEQSKAGISLPYKDVGAWTQAIERLMTDDGFARSCRQQASVLSESYRWSQVARPLLAYCRNPYRLPAFRRVRMPSLLQRAHAVYSRGGRQLVLKRSREVLCEILGRS